jgi:hypothetical protein
MTALSASRILPDAIVRLRTYPDNYVWEVTSCPYCGRRHSHGGGTRTEDPRDFLGLRVAHCAKHPDTRYQLVEVTL